MSGLNQALAAIQQKDDDLFAFELDGIEIVFRLPSVKKAQQYSVLLNMASSESEKCIIYETIYRSVVQDDLLINDAAELKAGLPETVARLVIRLSGLDETSIEYTEQLFNVYRNQTNSTIAYLQRTICSTFSGYTFEALDKLNYQNLVNVFIQAEKELLDRGIIQREHDFTSKEQAKEAPFKVEELIKKDRESFIDYDSPEQEDPRKKIYMQKLREGAKKRAEIEERNFKKTFAQQG